FAVVGYGPGIALIGLVWRMVAAGDERVVRDFAVLHEEGAVVKGGGQGRGVGERGGPPKRGTFEGLADHSVDVIGADVPAPHFELDPELPGHWGLGLLRRDLIVDVVLAAHPALHEAGTTTLACRGRLQRR